MKSTLLSAFACEPYKGSEPSVGWNWSIGLVNEGFEVHTITRRIHKIGIEKHPIVKNLYFHYISLPLGLEYLYSFSNSTLYMYYYMWQWFAYRKAKKLSVLKKFVRVHHVSWGSVQQGSFMYKLNVPFIFGPAGGGQQAPVLFREYFGANWEVEVKREWVSSLMQRFNPACKNMLKTASQVLVSNNDTYDLVQKLGAKNVSSILDAALPNNFFPEGFIKHDFNLGQLRLLWVGRLLPRKGFLIILEVMKLLKSHTKITLTVVGDGEELEKAKQKTIDYNLQDTVTYTGAVPYEDVRNFYTTHDTFIFTSLRDSCPMQLVEAMAFSLPVITLDLHGQGQIVNRKTGIKIPLENPNIVIKNLVNAVIELSNNSDQYNELSMGAYSFAKRQIWDNKVKNIVENYY